MLEPKDKILTKTIRAGSRTYFFDVKKSVKGDKYLTICESRKVDGEFQRNTIMIFADDIQNFFETLKEVEPVMSI